MEDLTRCVICGTYNVDDDRKLCDGCLEKETPDDPSIRKLTIRKRTLPVLLIWHQGQPVEIRISSDTERALRVIGIPYDEGLTV